LGILPNTIYDGEDKMQGRSYDPSTGSVWIWDALPTGSIEEVLMKVTMIAREFPPNVYGGAGVHLKYLVQELTKLMKVEVRSFGDQDIEQQNLKVKGYQGWNKFKEGDDKRLAGALSTLSVDLSIVQDAIDSDIVHTHTWYAAFAGYLAKLIYKVPFVITCHSLEPLRPWKEEQLGRGYQISSWVEKLAIEAADKIIGVSKAMKEDILEHFNVPADRVAVIYNGIDLNKWKKVTTNDTQKEYGVKYPYVLFVGRTTKQKGMVYLLDAADYIDPGFQIVCCTSAPDTKKVENEITRTVEGKKNVLWINKLLKEEQYIELYSGAEVFACPSIYEPFGIINLEAMACETPVVASAVGGIKDAVVPEETGILVEPANPKQLADGLNRLLRDHALTSKFGKNGRKRVEKYFGWSLIAKQTKNLYESLVHHRNT